MTKEELKNKIIQSFLRRNINHSEETLNYFYKSLDILLDINQIIDGFADYDSLDNFIDICLYLEFDIKIRLSMDDIERDDSILVNIYRNKNLLISDEFKLSDFISKLNDALKKINTL